MPRWAELVEDIHARLERFCAAQLDGASELRIEDLARVPGGASRETWSFDLRWTDERRPQMLACVLQRSPDGGLLDSDRVQEFHTLRALQGTGVPVPRPLWLDPDGRWLERPGFVMERAPGRVGGRFLLEPETAPLRAALADQFVDLAARLHMLEPKALDLPFAGTTDVTTAALEQVKAWEETLDRQELEPQPVLREAFCWLKARLPVAERISIVHGDFKFENLLFDREQITALLDWELVHLGDPVEDVAWAYRWYASTAAFLPFEDYLQEYRQRTGLRVTPEALRFYDVFTHVKAAIIGLTGERSFVDGLTRSDPRPGGIGSLAVNTVLRLSRLRLAMEREEAP